MKAKKGYKKIPLSFNRQAVIASASVTKAKNAIHCFTEIDITDKKVVAIDNQFEAREHLCLTVSFDHNIVDGAPAARFMNQLIKTLKSGDLIQLDYNANSR